MAVFNSHAGFRSRSLYRVQRVAITLQCLQMQYSDFKKRKKRGDRCYFYNGIFTILKHEVVLMEAIKACLQKTRILQ